MKIRRGVFRLPGAFLLLLTGCAQPFTGETLRAVQETVTFEKVLDNPRAYKGSVILWGGVIRKSTGQPGETNLLIIQSPLDSRRVPQTDKTQGEFIAHTPGRLDPEVYKPDMKATLAGQIDGVEEMRDGAQEYPRPLVRIIEIHAWAPKIWGILPVGKNWEFDETGPVPSPFNVPAGERTAPFP